MLVDFLRERLELRGTKYMCREGGCGACVVAARDGHRTFSINSCLISVLQCQGWEITTVEGLGDRLRGYHPVQRTLAEYDGTQCGFCSVGWVMSMYSLLESNHYDLTEYEIEDAFGSNICRCTGYRPILDAFKSFAKDGPKPKDKNISLSNEATEGPSTSNDTDLLRSNETNDTNKIDTQCNEINDIEDLKICKNKGANCRKSCKGKDDWCFVTKEDVEDKIVKKIKLKDHRVYYRVNEIQDIFDVLKEEGTESYMLVGGNTGKGAYHIFEYPRVLIDIGPVLELKKYYIDQNLVIGAGTTLTALMEIFLDISREHEEFAYLIKLYEHLNLVAHIPVRNVGTVAGNLMVKHRVPTFSSDVFLLMETIGATLTILDISGKVIETTPEKFLPMDMTSKLIVNLKIPPLSNNYHFVSFKIMPRAQNAHASVNSAFLYKFNPDDKETVVSARIVFGGISATFVHAKKTEEFVVGKQVFTNKILQEALKVLEAELDVKEIPGEFKPEFRKKLALGLFYKGLITIIPEKRLKPRYRSGIRDFRKTRPVSKSADVYDTNPIIWPITEPMPKVEALIQCAGEIKYVNDVPKQAREVHVAFVTSDVATGEILDIDPSPALKYPGVLAFFSAKDIPGKNTFMSTRIGLPIIVSPEEILADKTVKYYDQAIGLIVAESEAVAQRAALLVQVKYKTEKKPPLLLINQVRSEDPSRVSVFFVLPARDRGTDVQRVIKNQTNIFSQYHFTMETISCVARPSDDGIEVIPSSHYPDNSQCVVSEALNIPQNRVTMRIGPQGGSYGSRLTRSSQVVAACSLVSHLMNRPARMVLSIQGNMRVIGKRFPCTRDFEVGVNSKGEIQYLQYNFYEDNGYVFSEAIIYLAINSVRNAYESRRWQYQMFNVLTDNASNSWCRAPGTLEAIAMTEYIMEQISYELDLDPLEVRMNNISKTDPVIQRIVEKLTKDSDYYKRKEEVQRFNKESRWKKRGLGVALLSWSSIILTDFQVFLTAYHGDGTVIVEHGGVEIGQGINTKVTQVVAFTLNISIDKVRVKTVKEIDVIPNSVQTGASTTSESVCYGAIKCCQLLLERLTPFRQNLNDASFEVLVQLAWKAGVNLQTSYHTSSNDSSAYRADGAAVAEVELDVLTGEHEVLRVDLIEDVGTSINPSSDIGQIEGAFIMGMGYWTTEHLIYDSQTGELLTDRTWYYHVPQAKDIPLDFRVQLLRNSNNPVGVLGARVVGEPATCVAIVVGFALHDAIAASREDTGYPRNKWFNVDGPYTIEANVLKADVGLNEFLYD
ncbi:xanthine dehydrogenase 1 [Plutella xylostella]|uniref:xanthine dehydrogenase 1 n=1 Tax=Plutella xylostella TaxID=51655 RepID=UPI002032445C|nr:xanthine dehydrogenase 1 [Plutella xylostella]